MLCLLGLPQPSDAEPARYVLKDIRGNTRLADLHAVVELKTWEPDVMKGIDVVLDIANLGAEAVDLFDPIQQAAVC